MFEPTLTFTLSNAKDEEIKQILSEVYLALKEKGYNPESQIVGYILSEDPTYITTNRGARSLIKQLDRDDMLRAMVRSFLGVEK
ncbi:MAG: IreB family regulatory phosphoprotein [Oscillospiraceae bacterium]|nr:IreB family regulatory phosphoprotein [Oscillospiraceae bacterium]